MPYLTAQDVADSDFEVGSILHALYHLACPPAATVPSTTSFADFAGCETWAELIASLTVETDETEVVLDNMRRAVREAGELVAFLQKALVEEAEAWHGEHNILALIDSALAKAVRDAEIWCEQTDLLRLRRKRK